MTDATLHIKQAGPLVSLQDAGRRGGLRIGVSPSGPMDRPAFAAAHAALGNPAGSTAIEVSLGGISLTTDAAVTLAVTGGTFDLDVGGTRQTSGQVLTLEAGQTLTVRGGRQGSWAYVALAGRIAAPLWMNSAAHHSKSGVGSPAITAGQTLHLQQAEVRPTRLGALPPPPARDGLMRVVLGPQDRYFSADTLGAFLNQPFYLSPASDRMGMRLDGPPLPLLDALSIPSEPILRGSIQVAGDGVPTVLMADHQSTGGYPKIATVISCDTDRLAQLRAGDPVRFAQVSPREALEAARHHAEALAQYLEELGRPRGTLAERLMRENLIHGAVVDPFD